MKADIAYMTNRVEPKFEWFLESLYRQCNPSNQKVIIVDFYADQKGRREKVEKINKDLGFSINHITPKPSVWQGPHRLTNEDCFDASGARNTALIHSSERFIVYVDDLSVLAPEWYSCVNQAIVRAGWTFGSYRKVKKLNVSNGLIVGFSDHPHGHDNRRLKVNSLNNAAQCDQRSLFGCSLVAPTDELVEIGGWPEELCGGMGYEDCALGQVLFNRKAKTWFDPRMMTYESEELHYQPGNSFARCDPCIGDPEAKPRNDKSHAMLRNVASATTMPFQAGIKEARESVLSGAGYPEFSRNTVDWFTRETISEMKFR